MGIYYKATRTDGFDFYSRTIDYAGHLLSGENLPLKDGFRARCCTSGVYHASTSKADTLIGGEWPCRLFEVEGDEVDSQENKRGFLTLKVIRELPAWEALGPNGLEVVSFIDSIGSASFDHEMAASRGGRSFDSLSYAKGVARVARGAAWTSSWYSAWDAAYYASRSSAWYAAGDAAGAMVVRDLIAIDDFNNLISQWNSMVDEGHRISE